MTWELKTNALGQSILRIQLLECNNYLCFGEVIELLRSDRGFQQWFSEELRTMPFVAYYWETPPITNEALYRDFEYVVIDAPPLARIPVDSVPFSEYFRRASGDVVRFANLGRDAMLVAPVPRDFDDKYPHLGEFLRKAPPTQICNLWRVLFETLAEQLSDTRIWLSTSGLGVGWLHFRLDSIPKYYNYLPYKTGSW